MKLKILFLLILVNIFSYSQSVNDDEIQFFGGNRFGNSVVVDKQTESVTIRTIDYLGNLQATHKFTFDQLPVSRYLKIYNSIILLCDPKTENIYFYDLVNNKKSEPIPNSQNEYLNRYSEYISLGKFNPVLVGKDFKIIDDQLKVIRSFELDGLWVLMSDSDVITGNIVLLKLLKQGEANYLNEWVRYNYNVKWNKLELVK